MPPPIGWLQLRLNRASLEHSTRTALAGAVSFAVARLIRLPEAYWAAITTLIVMQSTLGGALVVSWKRLTGTALGAVVGSLAAAFLKPSALAFGATVLVVGIISALLRLDRIAYRFASITLAIVMLVERTHAAWVVGLHRFAEVSMGICVALLLTAVWPETAPPEGAGAKQTAASAGE